METCIFIQAPGSLAIRSGMEDRQKVALVRLYRGDHLLFEQQPTRDTCCYPPRGVDEMREHISTMAQLKGRRWYAKKL